ncbi:MAG: PEP-CTERM sorting domain-containing protein [Edaphobacter sp.]
MKISLQWLSAIAAIVIILSGSAQPACADSYSIFNLGDANGQGIYGIDTAGDVVIWSMNGCGVSATYCYSTYVVGVAASDGSLAPVLLYDNGSSCGSTPAGMNTSKTVCNGNWIGLGSLYNPNGDLNGVYAGSGSDLDYLGIGSVDQAFLNSVGDFAWTDGQNEEMYVAIRNSPPSFGAVDLSILQDSVPAETPEPGSLLLMATGLVGITAVLRRKANRYRKLSE